MKKAAPLIIVILGLLLVFLISSSAYVVPEGYQVVITQFGKPVGEPVTEAGLHFKVPFIQKDRRLDKRLLTWDGDANQIPTKDKKYILVDTTARWRIVDPLRFIESVQTERRARDRIDAILDSETRNVISNHNLVEVVRNTNEILEAIEEIKKAKASGKVAIEDEEVVGEIEKIEFGRENLSLQIVERARQALSDLGVEIIDVQIRRVEYEKSVEQKVFERMISERKRVAEKIRSVGRGEKAKINGRVSKDLQAIESEAYQKSQEIKGKADNQAIRIYAKALRKDPKFYEFLRSMEAYQNSLKNKDQGASFLLSTDSEFLKYLKRK